MKYALIAAAIGLAVFAFLVRRKVPTTTEKVDSQAEQVTDQPVQGLQNGQYSPGAFSGPDINITPVASVPGIDGPISLPKGG